ncbi:MAG: M20/M25/M40 family metallo-hydrolase [Deltaproteobacteria bacterium]|nr:M20/M25/M40 family metallo-hydrolase [Deltaproteobacteria bacterium]
MTSLLNEVDWKAEGDRCVELLQRLIRIPTVNPPGNEKPAAELLAEFLREAKVEPQVFESEPGRASLVARVKGDGSAPPLLLAGHIDVVEADASQWKHDPFSGEIADGCIWGRGAVDMKNMVAMSACLLSMIARSGVKLRRDVIFAAVADEEAGCEKGSHFLVNEHADLVRAEYMLGEVGGFSLHMKGRTFYPIMVAEKGIVWVRAKFRGQPGHGSMPREDSAVVRAADAISRLGHTRLPVHRTEAAQRFVRALGEHLPLPASAVLPRLTDPVLGKVILERLVEPAQRRVLSTYLSNTATPTVVRAGAKTNVVPGEATVEIDGRTLPGQTEEGFLRELRDVLGSEVELQVMRSMPPVETSPDTPLFEALSAAIRKHDPDGHPVPYLVPGFTDAKAFSRLGTKCYGFVPVKLDPDVSFAGLYHGNDERIPVEGLKWGLRVLADAVVGFCSP